MISNHRAGVRARAAFLLAALPLLLPALAPRVARAAEEPVGHVVRAFPSVLHEGVERQYATWLPKNYNDTTDSFPLILFLHGFGESGDDPAILLEHGPIKVALERGDLPFVVVSPQCPKPKIMEAGYAWKREAPDVEALVADAMRRYRIDPARVYLTGISMGGFGTYAFLGLHPDWWAAAVPICGGGDPDGVSAFPPKAGYRIYHGAKDTTVPLRLSERMHDAMKSAGLDVSLTIYPEAKHDSWTETYANPELYEWLLTHKREDGGAALVEFAKNAPKLETRVVSVTQASSPVASAAPGEKAEPRSEDFMVPMRDGVKLATTVHFPAGAGPWPTVMARTPYNKDGIKGGAKGFLDAGYAVVAQDCRGRYKSEGDYVPFLTDGEDGYDAVEWVAVQAWSDGKVGMWGGSALGITTNMAAVAAPPHLLAGFTIVAPASWREEALFQGGVWHKNMIDGWMAAQQATAVRDEWIARPPGDPYFDYAEIRGKYERIQIPIYNVGGWFDIFAQGSIDNFVGAQTGGSGLAKGNQKLLMAALGHGPINARWGKYPNKGDDFGSADAVRWFDRWLKGIDNGIDREPPIRYFLMGDAEDPTAPGNEWRTATEWPPYPSKRVAWFARPGGLSTQLPVAGAGADRATYDYDPKNPAPTRGGHNLILPKGPLDQREIGQRQDYLRFHGEPLAEPLTIIGRVEAQLFVETDAPDTDFMAKLVDVYPDGYEAVILDSAIRLKYRAGLANPQPVPANEVLPIVVDLWSTAYVFAPGHRVGLHVTSSNDPRFEPNANTGAPPRANDETRVARNTIHLSPSRASGLVLPVVEMKYEAKAAPEKGREPDGGKSKPDLGRLFKRK